MFSALVAFVVASLPDGMTFPPEVYAVPEEEEETIGSGERRRIEILGSGGNMRVRGDGEEVEGVRRGRRRCMSARAVS